MMDRDLSADDAAVIDPPPHPAPRGPIVVSVCTTCKTTDGGMIVGADMLTAVKDAIAETGADVQVRPVQCLSVCKRPVTVAITSPDGYTFLFGDLQTGSGSVALAAFVQSYARSGYGLVPWRERAEVLRKGMIARVPPMAWSPDDGQPPK